MFNFFRKLFRRPQPLPSPMILPLSAEQYSLVCQSFATLLSTLDHNEVPMSVIAVSAQNILDYYFQGNLAPDFEIVEVELDMETGECELGIQLLSPAEQSFLDSKVHIPYLVKHLIRGRTFTGVTGYFTPFTSERYALSSETMNHLETLCEQFPKGITAAYTPPPERILH